MKLLLKRIAKKDTYTIGKLYIDNVYFCDTLEDKVRDLTVEEKIMHETAIPMGSYKVVVNKSPKFQRELPRLLDVPYFESILIHRGNTARDRSGCILVGENKQVGKLINSSKYEIDLTSKIKQAGGSIIEII